MEIQNKIVTIQQFKKQQSLLSGKKVVFTNGCFDIIHYGHVHYLMQAKQMGDILVVGLNNDDSIRRLKGESRPINSENARAMMLAALQFVDFVILFGEDTPLQLIKAIVPDVLVKGNDYTIDKIVGADFIIEHGGTVSTLDFIDGYSTTNIIEKIKRS